MSVVRNIAGVVGVVGGVIGAAALGGMTAQRVAVNRYRVSPATTEEGFDTVHADRTYSVVAADGAVLHVEEIGSSTAPLTVVYSHGWALRMGSWYFQRTGLAGPCFGAQSSTGRPGYWTAGSHGVLRPAFAWPVEPRQ